MKQAIVTGASGLVGKALMEQLIAHHGFNHIYSLLRRSSGIVNEKVTEIVIDFDQLPNLPQMLSADCAFCCLGTTLKTAGSKDRQYVIDHDYVVNFAVAAKNCSVSHFAVVSSIGASSKSGNFYLRTKGEMENDCAFLNFRKMVIVRPSFLLGKRKEFRLMEKLGIIAIKIFAFMSVGTLGKYTGVQVERIAERMIRESLSDEHSGVYVIESQEI
jgi:uncharacterized protein YbjT (DUF2867 family)